MPLGLYISVPFCKTKCSYCNFASGVFSRVVFDRYITRLCGEIEQTANTAEQVGGLLERDANSVYVGGGTPTLLEIAQVERLLSQFRKISKLSRKRKLPWNVLLAP